MEDEWELEYSLNPELAADAEQDADSDGLTNKREFTLGTNPLKKDTDEDGHADLKEVEAKTNPLDPDSKPGRGIFGKILILFVVIILAGAVYFGYRYYKTAIAPARVQPLSKAPITQPPPTYAYPAQPRAVRPEASPHERFARRESQRRAERQKVFNLFDVKENIYEPSLKKPKRPVERPKPTENIFDKLSEVPVKPGEDVFEELKRGIAEEERLRRKKRK
jgi:hypothetical protein